MTLVFPSRQAVIQEKTANIELFCPVASFFSNLWICCPTARFLPSVFFCGAQGTMQNKGQGLVSMAVWFLVRFKEKINFIGLLLRLCACTPSPVRVQISNVMHSPSSSTNVWFSRISEGFVVCKEKRRSYKSDTPQNKNWSPILGPPIKQTPSAPVSLMSMFGCLE